MKGVSGARANVCFLLKITLNGLELAQTLCSRETSGQLAWAFQKPGYASYPMQLALLNVCDFGINLDDVFHQLFLPLNVLAAIKKTSFEVPG